MTLRLMCITAHPDDESAGFGGALLRAQERGARTSVLCLTDGGAASHRGATKDTQELTLTRRQEFAAALRVLGVSEGEVLGYPDGKLAEQSFIQLAAALVERIRRFRPQVVLTFGGDGSVNRHPDHTMASLLTTAAFHWAGRNALPADAVSSLEPCHPQKLYYACAPFLVATPEEARYIACVPSSLTLDVQDLKAKKYEAFRQHTTQTPVLDRAKTLFEKHSGEERYLLAAARGELPNLLETDMFGGVVEE